MVATAPTNPHTLRRRHRTKEGREKVPYETKDEAEATIFRLMFEEGRVGLTSYLCPVCEHYHLGRTSKRAMQAKLKRAYELELGARATYHLLKENYGGEDRIEALMQRWDTVAKRLR